VGVRQRATVKVESFTPDTAMEPIGPYSHITRAGRFIAISATAGVDPATGELAGPDAYAQTRQILKAFRAMLEGVGSNMNHVLHVHVFLRSIQDFDEMNRAYREEFGEHLPARSVIGVNELPKAGAVVTMNLTAVTIAES